MSLHIDRKYLLEISGRLPKFTRKSEKLYNFRCTVCGDSKKNPNRARAFFYVQKQDLFFKCHNCNVSWHFGTFLKNFDAAAYNRYRVERYTDPQEARRAFTSTIADEIVNVQPMTQESFRMSRQGRAAPPHTLERIATRLDALPNDHEAVRYVMSRKAPSRALAMFWYLPETRDILDIAPDEYKERPALGKSKAPRLVIPFYDERGRLTGVTLRALRGEEPRYLQVKLIDDAVCIFGFDRLDTAKEAYVTEGAFDSLFLDNAFAVNGVGFNKVTELGLKKDRVTLIFDNQPRNREVAREVGKYVNDGWRLVIWPERLEQKDLNEMVLSGHDVGALVRANTYTGLAAQAAFMQWRKC
jgi:hypothetical protein